MSEILNKKNWRDDRWEGLEKKKSLVMNGYEKTNSKRQIVHNIITTV